PRRAGEADSRGPHRKAGGDRGGRGLPRLRRRGVRQRRCPRHPRRPDGVRLSRPLTPTRKEQLVQQQGSFTPEQIAELQRHVGYGATWLGPVLVAGKGSRVTDIDGKSYIDCTAQAWTLALGYNHPEVTEAALAQMQALPHVRAGFPTLPRLQLAKR